MTPIEEKPSLEKFMGTLSGVDKELLSTYLDDQSYENLSGLFDQILEKNEVPKTDN